MKAYAIIAAAGQSLRMGIPNKNKVFLKFSGKSVLELSISAMIKSERFCGIIIVTRENDRALAKSIADKFKGTAFYFADGGETRQESVYNAIKMLPEDAEIVAVHDAARCFTSTELIKNCVDSAEKFGTGIAGRMSTDTVKFVENGEIKKTLDRANIALAETPQVFKVDILKKAHEKAKADGFFGTDDAQLVERLGINPVLVNDKNENMKLTYKNDIKKGENIIKKQTSMRIGNGIDVHRFEDEADAKRKLIIGGIEIESKVGLIGHSDADVLTHAIMDALLGAAGLPDIGVQFPDTADEFEGISSIELLKRTVALIEKEGYKPVSVDSTLVMQKPKIAKYVPMMRELLSEVIGCSVNVKATTSEKLGFTGRCEGAEAHAVALLTGE